MDSSLAKTIGTCARAARKALSLTQEEAAERVGISMEFYARIERGGTLPSVPTLLRIADGLDVDADLLLGRRGAGLRGAGVAEKPASYRGRAGPPSARAVPPRPVRRLIGRIEKASLRTVRLLNLVASALEPRR